MTNSTTAPIENQKQLFGHPVGLYILFFTEMWERFSYYGMRAILTLYMIQSVAGKNPGLGWDEAFALSIYGWYTMLVYVFSIPGGILADKYIGQKRSVMVGGAILVAGHAILAIDAIWAFYTGLALIIIGVGCLKPNISTMVGGLYKQGDIRRDQGFTIFYIGINIGAFLSALIVGFVGETYGWHYGFGLAGIGMFLGQVIYIWGQRFLKGVGEPPGKEQHGHSVMHADEADKNSSLGKLFGDLLKSPIQLVITAVIAIGSVFLAINYATGGEKIAYSLLGVFLALVIGMLMMIYKEINAINKDRFAVLLISFLIVIVFWGAFEQAGGLMNIYTLKKIDRFTSLFTLDILFYGAGAFLLIRGILDMVKKRDTKYIFLPLGVLVIALYLWLRGSELSDPYEIPASVFQSVNALFIIIFGTAVGSFWIWWQKLGRESSSLFKMALGTMIMGVGFLFMAKASVDVVEYGDKAALSLLILAYLLHTIGELCASPVALSFITKLAPLKYVSIMMGVYFAATGFGNKLAGLIGELSQSETINIEVVANADQLRPYTPDDSTLIKKEAFEIVGTVALEGEAIRLVKDGQNLLNLVNLDEENKEILVSSMEEYTESPEKPLTAVLSFDNEQLEDAEGLGYKGELEVFEIQDEREYWTFLSIFIFTALFGLLLLLFLKRLKKLTHDAEKLQEGSHHEEQEGYEIADKEGE